MTPQLTTTTTTTANTNDNNISIQPDIPNINNMVNSKTENNVPYDQFPPDSLQSILYNQSVFDSINSNHNNNSNSNVNVDISNIPNAYNPNIFDDNFKVTDDIDISKYLLNPTFEDLLSPRSQSPQTKIDTKPNIDELINGSNNSNVMTNKFSSKYLDLTPNLIFNDNNNNNNNNNNNDSNNRVIPFTLEEEESTTNLDDLLRDITSNSNNNNIINDNDLFLNDSFLNLDNSVRRHSDAFLTNNILLPSNMFTSRASISHQFDMWNGLQKNTHNINKNNSGTNNSTSLRKMASLNNSSHNMLLRTKTNKQPDTDNNNNNNNILKPNDNFNSNNISFIDPFNNNNNNNGNRSNGSGRSNSTDFIRPPQKRAVTSVKSTENIHQVSSPNSERRYNIRKAPYRSSVPTVDINILKELSKSARMTPLSNMSSSNDRFYNNLDNSLSSNNLVLVPASMSETVSLSKDTFNSISELPNSIHPNTESVYPFDNTLDQLNNGPMISPYSNYNNNGDYNHSHLSLPQRTTRSASVVGIYSNIEKSTHTPPLQMVTPSSVKYTNISNNACMKKMSPIDMNQQQLQMNQNLNQYSIPQMPQFIPASNRMMNVKNNPLVEQQHIANLPVQPIPQNTPMPSENQISNIEPHLISPPGNRRTSTTATKPNNNNNKKKKNSATKSNKEKIYQCEYCEKSFNRAEHRKRHIRSIHTQEKPFVCQLCDKKFSRSDNLKQHIKVHKKYESEEMKKIQLNILKDPSFT